MVRFSEGLSPDWTGATPEPSEVHSATRRAYSARDSSEFHDPTIEGVASNQDDCLAGRLVAATGGDGVQRSGHGRTSVVSE